MKGVFSICRYFLSWQLLLCWFSAIGLFFLVASPVVYLIYFLASDSFIFTLPILNPYTVTLYAYLCLIVLPFLSSPLAFRNLIANSQLSLIPNFRLKVGLSLLIFSILLSLMPIISLLPVMSLPLNIQSIIFNSMVIFCIASLYTLFFQLSMPSRYFIYIVSYGLILVVLFLSFFAEIIFSSLGEASLVVSFLFIFCIFGWIVGLNILAKKKAFKPADQSIFNQDSIASPETTWGGLNFVKTKSASGTLLTGLPDGIGDRIKRAFMVCILSPFIVAVFLMMIGFGDSQGPESPHFTEIFLIFSFFTVSIGTYTYSNLAARTRYLWLRCGGNRLWQWQHMESTMYANLYIQFSMLTISCLLILIFTDFSAAILIQYILSFFAISALITYMGLASRINNWPAPLLFILMVGTVVAVIIFYFRLVIEEEFLLKILIDVSVILFAVFLRYLAKRGFQRIDWLSIKPEVPKSNTMYS